MLQDWTQAGVKLGMCSQPQARAFLASPRGEGNDSKVQKREGRRSPSWIKAEWSVPEILALPGSREDEHCLWSKSRMGEAVL